MTTTTDALVRIALAGTGQGAPEVATGTPVDAITASLSGAEPARRLLLTAGAWGLFRQAGRTPDPAGELPAPAREETRAVCARTVAEKVRELCLSKRRDLLIEVGRCLDAAGQRLPPEVLPAVLRIREEKTRAALLPALGERGRWLGQFRDGWRWAVAGGEETVGVLPEDADAVWEEGTADRRLALLRLARRLDPGRSRDWLTRVWKAEKVPQRLAFLETFAQGPGADDEAFLETLLDDRSQQVRAKAAELLAGLPAAWPWPQKRLRLKPSAEIRHLELDLRKQNDRRRSRLLHRLRLLDLPWGQPGAAAGARGTFREPWQIQWQPEFPVKVIEASIYGSTVEEAASGAVIKAAQAAEELAALTELLDQAVLAELPAAVDETLACLQARAAVASDVRHLMDALPPLARVARYGDVRGTPSERVLMAAAIERRDVASWAARQGIVTVRGTE